MLPQWYVLADPPDTDLDLAQWRRLGDHRRQMLEEVSSGVDDAVSKYISRTADIPIGKVSYEDSFKGHFLLRLLASTSEKLRSWLVETEGDIFDYEFTHEGNLDKKRQILKDVFGSAHVKTLAEFAEKFDTKLGYTLDNALKGRSRGREFICVHYTQASEMLSWRRIVEMHKSWLIARPHEFKGALKRRFEENLERSIDNSKALLDEIRDTAPEVERLVLSFAEELEEHVQLRSKFALPELEGLTLQTEVELFPPCMRIIIAKLETAGYLTHFERLEIGFFLKRVGMSVEEQLKFWYEKSVDNVGLSFDEFVRRRGYQIRHLYGIVGGGKDYNVPKCRTIARGYFCPFAHLPPETLEQTLEEGLPGASGLAPMEVDAILRLVMNHRQLEACGRTFTALYGAQGSKKIFHPLQWVKDALEVRKPSVTQP
ncbi:MAG: hypothetical protein ACE5OZ_15405 [Candidatus Heimdallarchaeota archaeon]